MCFEQKKLIGMFIIAATGFAVTYYVQKVIEKELIFDYCQAHYGTPKMKFENKFHVLRFFVRQCVLSDYGKAVMFYQFCRWIMLMCSLLTGFHKWTVKSHPFNREHF